MCWRGWGHLTWHLILHSEETDLKKSRNLLSHHNLYICLLAMAPLLLTVSCRVKSVGLPRCEEPGSQDLPWKGLNWLILEQSWTPSGFLHQPSGLDCRRPLSFLLPPGAETSWPLEVRETGDDVWEGSEVCVLTLTRVCAVIALRLCFRFAVRVGNTTPFLEVLCEVQLYLGDLCRGSETGDDGCLNSLLWFFRIWVASVVLVIKVGVGEGGIFLYPSRS